MIVVMVAQKVNKCVTRATYTTAMKICPENAAITAAPSIST
jgi:hypothetical protein